MMPHAEAAEVACRSLLVWGELNEGAATAVTSLPPSSMRVCVMLPLLQVPRGPAKRAELCQAAQQLFDPQLHHQGPAGPRPGHSHQHNSRTPHPPHTPQVMLVGSSCCGSSSSSCHMQKASAILLVGQCTGPGQMRCCCWPQACVSTCLHRQGGRGGMQHPLLSCV